MSDIRNIEGAVTVFSCCFSLLRTEKSLEIGEQHLRKSCSNGAGSAIFKAGGHVWSKVGPNAHFRVDLCHEKGV